MSVRRLMVLAVAVLALAAAGCGGGGSSSSEASGDTDTVVTDTTATETTDTTTTEDMTSTEATDTGTSTDDFDVNKLGGKCAELVGAGTKLSEALSGQNADINDYVAALDQLADKVPDEIKGDFQVLVDYMKKLAGAMKGVDTSGNKPPSAEALAKLQQLATSADAKKVQQASQHLEAWAKANC